MTRPFKLKFLDVNVVRSLPDGDYTVGRGADPRSVELRAMDPDGSIARAQQKSLRDDTSAGNGHPKRARPQAAE